MRGEERREEERREEKRRGEERREEEKRGEENASGFTTVSIRLKAPPAFGHIGQAGAISFSQHGSHTCGGQS